MEITIPMMRKGEGGVCYSTSEFTVQFWDFIDQNVNLFNDFKITAIKSNNHKKKLIVPPFDGMYHGKAIRMNFSNSIASIKRERENGNSYNRLIIRYNFNQCKHKTRKMYFQNCLTWRFALEPLYIFCTHTLSLFLFLW